MTTVGMVGGLGPESTIDYYRRVLEAWRQQDSSSAPSIVIDSLDVRRALYLVENDRPGLTEYLLSSIQRLGRAGVDFAVMTANTPHVVFDELAARSPVPLVSIVEVCAEEGQRRGLRRLGLLGTRFTMEAPFYSAVCARYGSTVVIPNDTERTWIHERYVGELLKGEFRDDTRQRLQLNRGSPPNRREYRRDHSWRHGTAITLDDITDRRCPSARHHGVARRRDRPSAACRLRGRYAHNPGCPRPNRGQPSLERLPEAARAAFG